MRPVPSYRGYDAPARAPAGHGYQIVSITADANTLHRSDDGGALARAQLGLAFPDLWKQRSTRTSGPYGDKFVGRADLQHVGLMGHPAAARESPALRR
jgi:hypothetical protein